MLFTLAWILSIACGGAVFVLGAWHLFMVARGETSIESHDNDYLDKKAKSEGLVRPSSDSNSTLTPPRFT